MTAIVAAPAPAADFRQALDRLRRSHARSLALLFAMAGVDEVEVATDGARVRGSSGRWYLDFGSYSVFLLGHRHPDVVAAVRAQLDRAPLASRSFPTPSLAEAVTRLTEAAPPALGKCLLLNSGAEAVDAALKLARLVTGRDLVLHVERSFHGKTLGALSVTDSPVFRAGLVTYLPTARISRSDPVAAGEEVRRRRPAAVIVEPVQGEGGAVDLGTDYLGALRAACDGVGALFVADEIQCGLGRCGDLWVSPAHGVVPDLLLAGKALGGGVLPVSAVVGTEAAMAPFDADYFVQTSTFGGNPLAATAAVATLEVIARDDIPGRARRLGDRLRLILAHLRHQWPELFADVTGRGLLLGLRVRDASATALLIRAGIQEGILLTPCLTDPEVIRLSPPAIVDEAVLEQAATCLGRAAARTASDLAEVRDTQEAATC